MIRKSNLPKWLKNSLNIVRLSIGSLFIILSFSFVGSSADDISPKAPAIATFLPGQDFNHVIESFVHVSDIVRFTRKDDCGTARNIVSTRDSQNPIYVIDDGRGTVYYCTRADSLYLSPDSSGMFSGRVSLEKIDMDGWDTSNVTDMSHMFAGCSSLPDLDLSTFDTRSVTDMSNMFQGCSGLIKVNISRFDTSNVTDMSHMFAGCSSLPDLDLRSFDTSNVTDMSNMFQGCSGLIKVTISRFDTSNVRDMSYMFAGCISLSDLDLSSFNTRSVRDMSSMFYGDSGFKTLKLSNFDTSSVTDMSHMFQGCSGLDYLDISRFDTRNVSDMNEMFSYAKNLKYLDLRSFDTRNVTDMSSMFYGNNNLKRIYATNAFVTTNVHASSGQNMFTSNTLLMGGSGTMYNPNYTDKSYAKIDGGTQNPGYFTLNGESPSILVGSTSRTDVNSSTQVVIDLNLVAYGINTGDFTISDLIFKIGDNTINPTTRTLTYDYSSGSDNYYKLTLNGLSGNGNLSVIVKTGAISDYLGTTSAYTEFNNILTVDNIPPECVVTQQPTNILLKDGDSGSFTMKCTSTGSRINTATQVDETSIEYDPDVVDLGINFSSMTTEGISEITYYFDYFALGDGTTTFQLKENMISDNAGNYNTSSPLTDPVTVDMTAPTVSIFSDGSGTCTTGNIYTVTGIFSEAVTGINASTLTVNGGTVQDFNMISDTVAVWTVQKDYVYKVETGGINTLTICDPSGINPCITMMDRNLGATTNDINSTGSFGYYYQWGNNHGLVRSFSGYFQNDTTTYKASRDSGYSHHGYDGGITGFMANRADYWTEEDEHHDDLWGGENDSESNNRGLDLNNPEDRKGPCPDGYHVPSAGEWKRILEYRSDESNNTISDESNNTIYTGKRTYWVKNFDEIFNIPLAGYRLSHGSSLIWMFYQYTTTTAHLWSSSISYYGNNDNFANVLLIENMAYMINSGHSYKGTIDIGMNSRAYALSLRCFKNIPLNVSVLTGNISLTIETGAVIDLAGNINTTGSNIISWDYDQAGPTGTIDVKYNGNDNTALGTILNLNLSAQDEGCNNTVMMQFSCDGNNRSTLEPFVTTKNFKLSNYSGVGCTTTNGTKTIYVRYIDGFGNTGGVYSDSITLNNLDIVIQASSTAANKTLKINKYFSNSYMVDRGDGELGNVNTDKTHTYSASGTYNITLLLTGGATRWGFNECTEKPLIPISGTTMGGVAIIYMPSLAKGFGDTSSINPGNCFFRFFNRQGAITSLPEGSFKFSSGWRIVGDSFFSLFNAGGRLTSLPSGSFDTSYITSVGYGFFAWFNWGGRLTSLPDGSFNISQIFGTVDDYFFSYFNNNGKLTSLPSGSFDTSSIMRAGSNFFSYFNYQGEIAELPSGSFNISNIIKVGNDAFSNFNFDGNITNLPTGSFDTSSIITVGNSFFSYFNQKGALTSLPAGSFTFSGGLKTVGDNFFSNFNYSGKLTSLPSGSFNTSNIRSAGNSFFSYFNNNGKLTSLPSGSFNTSNIRSAGNSFFSYFNYGGKITSLPTNSFNISNLTGVGSNFFSYFNYGGSMTSLPAGSFNTSNITTAGSNFFAYFNKLGKITNLPASFTMSSVGASVSSGYRESFDSSNYTLNRNVSDLVSGVVAPGSDRNTFSDNQPGRCGVHVNRLVNTTDACSITYNSNGGSTISNPTKKYTANTTGVVAGSGVTTPTKTNFAFDGWYTDPEGGTLVETVSFPLMDSGILYAHWREAIPPTVTISSNGSGICSPVWATYTLTGTFSEAVTGIDRGILSTINGDIEDFNMVFGDIAVWTVKKGFVYGIETGGVKTLTICDSNGTGCITMMDRNLGATASNINTIGTGKYGYQYQRGNNHGLSHPGLGQKAYDYTSSKATWDDSYSHHGYDGPITGFIYGSDDYRANNEHYDNLRGGENDTAANNYGYPVTNPTERRGPCDTGYHVPSEGEWNKLLEYWAEEKGVELLSEPEYPSLYYIDLDSTITSEINYNFNISFPGIRRSYGSTFIWRFYQNTDIEAHLWSSSPYTVNGDIKGLDFMVIRENFAGSTTHYRANSHSVRCFRDTPLTIPELTGIVSFTIETGVFKDLAGNANAGSSNTISWEYDAVGPTGTIDVKFNGGDTYATGTTFNLILSASDQGCNGGVSGVQFSCNGTNRTAVEPFAVNKTFTLENNTSAGCTTGDGIKTIYARYIDGFGNTGESVSDSIKLNRLSIVLEATATGANQTLNISKYFANAYTVDRGDGTTGNLTADTTHTYSTSGIYTITLSLAGTANRWKFRSGNGQLIPKSGTTVTGVQIVYMPSLADGFGDNATNPGNNFFSQFNRDGAITSLPAGSFDTSNIRTVGDSFFTSFNHNGSLINLPAGSFNISNISGVVGDKFFGWFNSEGKLTNLPNGSFDISNITVVGDDFFDAFNQNGGLTSLPAGSFNTSNISGVVGDSFFGWFNFNGSLISLPEGSFDMSNITSAGDYFFSQFNYDGALTSLPNGSFDISNITMVGNDFFNRFNELGQLTSLPNGSFNTSNISGVVGDNFFKSFNYEGKLTILPNGSFDILNITSVGSGFFYAFNTMGIITSLPEGSFDTSNITTVGDEYFAYFNLYGGLTSLPDGSFRLSTGLNIVSNDFFFEFNTLGGLVDLPRGSFDTSHIRAVGDNFLQFFNYDGKITSLPEGSFDMSNITSAGDYFFSNFNYDGALTSLPSSFTISSVGAAGSGGYFEAFNSSNYTLNKNVSDLVSGVVAPADDRNTFSDNQPGRCGVHPNWLDTTADACSITYDSNGGSTIANPTQLYTADTTSVVAGFGISTPTRANYAFDGWYNASVGGTKITTVTFPSMDSGTLYAHWREAVPPTVTISSEGSGMCVAPGTVYTVTGTFSEAVTGINASTLTVNGGTVQDFNMISDTEAVWTVKAGSGLVVTYYPDANVSYTLNPGFDTEGHFTAGLITITDGTNTYTIMDRNLGATSTDIDSIDSYGYYFQWGNNYGFPNTGDILTSYAIVDVSDYGPGNYYSSNTFIVGNFSRISGTNNDLRGGVTNTEEAMRGPCPDGFHVPSSGELLNLITMLGYDGSGSSVASMAAKDKLRTELLFPFTFGRGYFGDVMTSDQINIRILTWSSVDAYFLGVENTTINIYNLYNTFGFPLRCFKDSPYSTSDLSSEDGVVSIMIETGAFEDLAGNTNTTGSNTISWNYDQAGPTGSIDVKYNGNDNYASGTTLNLTLDAQDLGCNNTVSKMQFSCDGTSWSTLENFVSSKNFSLSNYSSAGCTTADGEKTIYVRYVDGLGNTGESYSDTITVDLVRPEEPRCAPVAACFSGSSPTITCSTTSSDGIVRYTTNGNTPTCSSSAWSDQSFSETTTLKVIACDPAGNYSSVTGYTYTKDTTAPRVPVMTIEPTYTQGLSNIVTSTEVRDVGCAGKVEYQFCMKSESRLMSGGDINSILQNLGEDGIDGIERTGAMPSKSPKIVELGQSQGEVQAWYEKGIIYIYTKGDILKFPEDSSSMFANMEKLQSINLGDIDTSNVKNMSRMFSNCKSLQELDLGQFDTSNVTNMTEMFAGDGELKTIYASDSFVIGNKIKSDSMFLNCSSIVGGVGTTYDDKYIDATYARIDSKKLPGYFTRAKTKEDTQKAPSSDDGFGCDQVTDWLSEGKTVFENLNDGQTYIYFVRSRDKLENTSAWSSGTSSTQDNTAPVVSLDGNGTPRFANSGTTITIYIKVTDIISGINTGDFAVGDLTFKVGNTSVTPSTKTLTWQSTSNGENLYKLVLRGVTGNGTLTVISAANAIADRVGNSSVTTILTPNVVIDNINPTCNLTQNPSSGTWTSGDATLTATVTETNPDKYSWTGWNNLLTTFTTYTTGSNGIRTFYVQDKAGNRGTCEITINNIDKTAPDTPICTTNACYSGSQAVTCSTSSSDGTIRYTTNGNTPTCSSNVRSDQSFSATTTLKVIACDPAGNYSSVTGYTYTKDNTAPTFTFANNSGAECTAGTLTIANASDGTGCAGLHASAYKFGGGSWGTATSTSIAVRQPGSVIVTGYVRDSLGNETSKTARYMFNDVAPTAIDFSVDGVGTGKTVNWKILSSATEGLCGSGNLSASVVSRIDTTMGSCIINGDNITFVATGGASGTATCDIQIKDNENSIKTITVTWNDVSRPIPQISFANSTPSHNAVVTQNRFTTKMDITNIDGIQSFEYEYNNTPYDLMSGLVLMYNFDNIASLGESTTVVKDLSKYGNDGTISSSSSVSYTSDGKRGGAYNFAGGNINAGNDESLRMVNNFTVSAWIKTTRTNSSNTYFLGRYDSSNDKRVWGIIIPANKKTVGFYGSTNGTSANVSAQGTKIVADGKRHLITMVHNGSKMKLYVDGTEDAIATNTSLFNTNAHFVISSSSSFNGQIDEVRMYNRALSQKEVQFLYKSNLKKTNVDTWEFETINTCLDMSGTYNYTGRVVSYVDTQATTGRRLTTNISDVSVDSTGYDFGTHTASGSQQVLRGTMGTLTVTDKLGKSGWKVYLTTSPTLVGETTHQTIDTNNLKFKATNLIYSGLYDGVLNTHVTLGNGMSTSQYHTAHGNAETDNILEYIVRTGDVDDFMCGDVGIYSDNTQIELTVPAWQIQDTYTGTLWVTLQQN